VGGPGAAARGGGYRGREEQTEGGLQVDQARVVVIGGGITGCSVAYHLAEAGWTDVLLVEKAQLTAGATCQAAGLVTMFNPSSSMMRFRRYSVELYERLGASDAWTSFLRLRASVFGIRVSLATPESVDMPAFAGTVTLRYARPTGTAEPSPTIPVGG